MGRRSGSGNALPGASRGGAASFELSSRRVRPEIRSKCVRFSPTGRAFAAASTEGLVVYSLDDAMLFAPFELTEAITPEAVRRLLRRGRFARALVFALHLNEPGVIRVSPVQSGWVWGEAAWHGMAWHGMAWHGIRAAGSDSGREKLPATTISTHPIEP